MSASDDVWHAVDEITRPNKKRLIRDDGTVIWVEEPSLWDQLAQALHEQSGSEGRGIPGSRSPCSIDIAEWRRNIGDVTADALVSHEKAMRSTVPESLRLLASTVASTVDEDLIREWVHTFRKWARAARVMLKQTTLPRPIRGAQCPSCLATYTHVDTPDGKVKTFVLTISFNNNLVRSIDCLACEKTWIRGDPIRELAEALDRQGDVTEITSL